MALAGVNLLRPAFIELGEDRKTLIETNISASVETTSD
jgi:hypothetical protein